MDADRSGRRVAVPDLRRVGRHWPVFTPRALGAGMAGVCAFPMRLRAERMGALNVFQATPGEFDQAAVLAGQALADVATIAILQARAVEELENHVLQPVIMSRTVELSALTVLVSILIGVELFGFLGALLAIPVAGVLHVIGRDLYDGYRGPPQARPDHRHRPDPGIAASPTRTRRPPTQRRHRHPPLTGSA